MNAAPEELGFGLDEQTWLGVVRESLAAVSLGAVGGYVLLEELGRGSQGAVFRAVQPGTNRAVAIKRVPGGPMAGSAARARLAREVEALSVLSHPGIVTVHGVESGGGEGTLLVMELVEGLPIDRWAAQKGATLRQIVETFALVADAIAYAHRKGVIHRDLKPSNVLVTADGTPRVLDFGLATLVDPGGLRVVASIAGSGFLGTPAYASPEQLRSDRSQLDTRTDIYALGVLMYQALTGRLPYPQEGLAALIESVQRGGAPRPSSLNAAVDRDLDAVVLTAMAPEPAARYQSADALAADLRRWLGGERVGARPPSRVDRVYRAVRRSPVASGAVLLGSVAVAALAVAASVQTVRLSASAAALEKRTRSAEQTAATLRQMIATVTAASAAQDAEPVQAMIDEAMKRLEADGGGGGGGGGGDHDPATLNALWLELAHAAFAAEIFDRFAHAVEVGLPAAERLYGREHPVTADWITCQGLEKEQRRDLPAARALYEEAMAILLKTSGEREPATARAANNLGVVLRMQREYAESERVLRMALAWRRAVHGERHEKVATTLRNLASTYRDRDDLEGAAKLYDEALAALPEGTEPAAVVRLTILHNRARLLRDMKRYDEALAMCDGALEVINAARGPRAPIAARFHDVRADLLTRQGEYEQALRACGARDRCDAKMAANNPLAVRKLLQTGELRMRLGRWEEAVSDLEAAVKAAPTVDPPEPALVEKAERMLSAARERRVD